MGTKGLIWDHCGERRREIDNFCVEECRMKMTWLNLFKFSGIILRRWEEIFVQIDYTFLQIIIS